MATISHVGHVIPWASQHKPCLALFVQHKPCLPVFVQHGSWRGLANTDAVAAEVGNGEVAVLGRQLEQSRQAIVELTMIMNEQREATALLHSKLDLAEDNRKADAKAAARVAEAAVKSGAATEKRRGKERAEDMNSAKIREAKRGRERVEDKAAIKEQERKQAEVT